MKPLEIGVCSWSIDRHDVVRSIESAGDQLDLRAVQIGFFTEEAVRKADPDAIVRAAILANVTLVGAFVAFEREEYALIERIAATGGYALDEEYPARLGVTRDVAKITAAVGCRSLALHVGTIPADARSPVYEKLMSRVREAADAVADFDMRLLAETGRESADVLLAFLESVDRPNLGVNFDPANFVIYGTDDPPRALVRLKGLIGHVHVKDARQSARPGTQFGQPAPVGSGDAGIPRVVSELRAQDYSGPLLIECGRQQAGMDGVRSAASYLRSVLE
jgi:sugar phosphate isomerase/epimerase